MPRSSRELDYATEAVADFLRELVRLRSCGLVPEIQPFATASELEQGHLARAVRTYLLEAIRWAHDNPREPPVDVLTPLADALEPEHASARPTAPPPAGWDGETTPLQELGYERKLTGDLARYLPPKGAPPPPPGVLSKRIRDRGGK